MLISHCQNYNLLFNIDVWIVNTDFGKTDISKEVNFLGEIRRSLSDDWFVL